MMMRGTFQWFDKQTNSHIQAYKHAQCVFFLSEAETKNRTPNYII